MELITLTFLLHDGYYINFDVFSMLPKHLNVLEIEAPSVWFVLQREGRERRGGPPRFFFLNTLLWTTLPYTPTYCHFIATPVTPYIGNTLQER